MPNYKITPVGKMPGGQDGAIYGDYFFRFNGSGGGRVYDAKTLAPLAPIALEKSDLIKMHSNAVVFGTEKYDSTDEFPLLYSNVYNNYSKETERRCGTAGVYRILHNGEEWSTVLVQVIRIAFTENTIWRSANVNDVRPYGNFVVDTDKNKLYAFTMRDEAQTTRYFRFALPACRAGEMSEYYGVPVLSLTEGDLEACFDAPYSHFIQGATYFKGQIWSVEGFGGAKNAPRLQIIDLATGKQYGDVSFYNLAMDVEPECITIRDGDILYSDAHGNTYKIQEL